LLFGKLVGPGAYFWNFGTGCCVAVWLSCGWNHSLIVSSDSRRFVEEMKFLALHALLSVACSSLSVPGGIKFDSKKLEHGLSIARQIESQAVGMATPGNCSVDFRARMKPCEQQGEDWCWATGISEWSYFYNISNMTAECDAVALTFCVANFFLPLSKKCVSALLVSFSAG